MGLKKILLIICYFVLKLVSELYSMLIFWAQILFSLSKWEPILHTRMRIILFLKAKFVQQQGFPLHSVENFWKP